MDTNGVSKVTEVFFFGGFRHALEWPDGLNPVAQTVGLSYPQPVWWWVDMGWFGWVGMGTKCHNALHKPPGEVAVWHWHLP